MTDLPKNSSGKEMMEFLILKGLPYSNRLFISLGIIAGGFILQYIFYSIFPGLIVIFLGNLLLLPRGISNRVKAGTYNPSTDWEKVDKQKLDEFEEFHKKMRKWDSVALDISNAKGGCLFFLISGFFSILLIYSLSEGNTVMGIMSIDIIVLLIPYWITGNRSVAVVPLLIKKIKLVENVLKQAETLIKDYKVDYFFLLRNKITPEDFKIKVNIPGQKKDFLGFYGQMSVNQGAYLYFYTVLVAKKGYGLKKIYDQYLTPHKLTKEFKNQGEVEVFVLRQNTNTVSMGYVTNYKQALFVFTEGLKLAEKAAI